MPALAHLGLGLATKRLAPQIPLRALLISSVLLDILTIVFFSALWITHGLFMSFIWAIIAILAATLITMFLKSRKKNDKPEGSEIWSRATLYTSMIIGLLVFSHWLFDFIGWPMDVINPTLTGVPLLFDDAVNIGLGVYSTWFGALFMDIGVFVTGLAIYLHYLKRVKKLKISR